MGKIEMLKESIHLPYDVEDLRITLRDMDPRRVDLFDIEEVAGEILEDFPNPGDVDQLIATGRGITAKELVERGDYLILVSIYLNIKLKRAVRGLARDIGISEKEVWSVAAIACGLLEL